VGEYLLYHHNFRILTLAISSILKHDSNSIMVRDRYLTIGILNQQPNLFHDFGTD
jgi:hypothetical protein